MKASLRSLASLRSFLVCIVTLRILILGVVLVNPQNNRSTVVNESDYTTTLNNSKRHAHILDTNFYSDLSFLPLDSVNCEKLFEDKNVTNKSDLLPPVIARELSLLNKHFLSVNKTMTEGYTAQFITSELVSIELVQLPFVRTVCETGFNAGHSTLTYLVANPNVRVYSFDIGGHDYSRDMAIYLRKRFPNR